MESEPAELGGLQTPVSHQVVHFVRPCIHIGNILDDLITLKLAVGVYYMLNRFLTKNIKIHAGSAFCNVSVGYCKFSHKLNPT